MKKTKPLTEGMTRKGGRNQGASQVKRRPPPPKSIKDQSGASVFHVSGRHFLEDAIKEAMPKLRSALKHAVENLSLNVRCPRCGNIERGFNAREPEAGFYWARRKDDRMLIVQVHDNQGRKSVSFFGNDRSRQGLRFIRENFVFVQCIEPPAAQSKG